MKDIVTKINESLEIEDSTKGYRIVTLVRHEDIDCANISEDDFCKFIIADLKKAYDEYEANRKPERDAANEKWIKDNEARLRKYAESKWKTERKRNEYVQNAIANVKTNPFTDKLSFVDFDVNPGTNGINSVCILHPETIGKKEAKACFNVISDNEYFQRATGWAIKYEADTKSLRSCFRPYVDLLGDESLKKEMEEDKRRLNDAIANFYSGSNYWGD